MYDGRADMDILQNARVQVQLGLKRRDEEHVRTVFRQHARQLMGRFAPVRPCSCSEQLIHGKEFLRSALVQLKVSVRDDHEFEEVYREVVRKPSARAPLSIMTNRENAILLMHVGACRVYLLRCAPYHLARAGGREPRRLHRLGRVQEGRI